MCSKGLSGGGWAANVKTLQVFPVLEMQVRHASQTFGATGVNFFSKPIFIYGSQHPPSVTDGRERSGKGILDVSVCGT